MIGFEKESLFVRETAAGGVILPLDHAPGEETSLDFSADGTRVAASSHDIVIVWDAETGQRLLELKGTIDRTSVITSVALSPDGRRVAVGGDSELKIWNAKALDMPKSPRRKRHDPASLR